MAVRNRGILYGNKEDVSAAFKYLNNLTYDIPDMEKLLNNNNNIYEWYGFSDDVITNDIDFNKICKDYNLVIEFGYEDPDMEVAYYSICTPKGLIVEKDYDFEEIFDDDDLNIGFELDGEFYSDDDYVHVFDVAHDKNFYKYIGNNLKTYTNQKENQKTKSNIKNSIKPDKSATKSTPSKDAR